MKRAFGLIVAALLCGLTAMAQSSPFDVDNRISVTKSGSSTYNEKKVKVKEEKNTNPTKTPTATGLVYKGENGDPLHYKIVDNSRRLVEVTCAVRTHNLSGRIRIPSTVRIQGKTFRVVNIGENAFKGCTKITSIEIMGNELQKLCHDCFNGCTGLTSIRLNPNCLNVKRDAFVGCSKLGVIILSSKANNKTFRDCNARVQTY
ncbi:MAG: leucine-rich repeat protein [Bacteroidales bacterium]|nr:leucine-rich repeat protein [Bacteroidales bacterium]